MAQDRLTVEVRLEIGDTEFAVRTSDYDLAKHIVYHATIHMDAVRRLSTGNRENQAFLAGWRLVTDKLGLEAILSYGGQVSTKAPIVTSMNEERAEKEGDNR